MVLYGTSGEIRLKPIVAALHRPPACRYRPTMADDYNIGFDILTEAVRRMGAEGITQGDVLPSLIDFTATVAIALGGEEAVRACIIRLGDRIKDYHAGIFRVPKN
jgi:hypothetical protein